MRLHFVSGISSGFPGLFQSQGQVTHVLLTRSPLITQEQALKITVRLACVKHAASVRPEPGSNSPLMNEIPPTHRPGKNPYPQRDLFVHKLSTNNQLSLLFVVQPKDIRTPHTPETPHRSPDMHNDTRLIGIDF